MIDKALISKISQRIIKTRETLLLKYPFFGELAMNMNFGIASCDTAYTDMKRIVFDPDFVNRLNDMELLFVMMHELMHCVLKHPKRASGKLQRLYNIACDIVVNSNILDYLKLSEFEVDGECVMHLSPSGNEGRNMCVEKVYEELISSGDIVSIIYSSGTGKMVSIEDLQLTDNHSPWEELTDDGIMSDKWDRIIHKFSEKKYSEMDFPQTIRDIFDEERKNAKLKWKEFLRDFLSINTYSSDYTFSPPDRRLSYMDFFLPGDNDNPEESIQNIWFCIDTSASISPDELSTLYHEVQSVTDQLQNVSGLLSFFDTSVTDPILFSSEDDFRGIKPTGGGGTRFDIIFKYMSKNMANHLPNAIVILTDGYALDVDERLAMGVPVLWILINNKKTKPWGKTIHIER